MNFRKPVSLSEAADCDKLKSYLRSYLKSCQPPTNTDSKRAVGKFPNPAGFCRFLGCGISHWEAFRLSHPEQADWLNAVMEDEALNCSALLSPTILNAYLKRRLGYTERADAVSGTDCGEVRVIFEHDIGEDGA